MIAEKVTYETRIHKGHTFIKCQNSVLTSKYTQGRICNSWVQLVNDKSVAALCRWCTGRLIPPPVEKKRVDPNADIFPRGWKFKKIFVTKSKEVYFKGIIQPALAGKYEPTEIVVSAPKEKKPKLSKHAKKELRYNLLRELNEIREKLDDPKELNFADNMKISSRRTEIEKQLNTL